MERNLQQDYLEAKKKVGLKMMYGGVEIKNLTLREDNTSGQSSSKKHNYYEWKFQLTGAENSYWKRVTYDVYIDFHRHRHPYTRPRVYFPWTRNNKGNPAHPYVCRETLTLIHQKLCGDWNCLTTGIDIIELVASLFAIDITRPMAFKTDLGPNTMTTIISFLDVREVLKIKEVCRSFLLDVKQDTVWLGLYQRSPWINSAIDLGAQLAPVRFYDQGKWKWENLEEAYRRMYECHMYHNGLTVQDPSSRLYASTLLAYVYSMDSEARKTKIRLNPQIRRIHLMIEHNNNNNIDNNAIHDLHAVLNHEVNDRTQRRLLEATARIASIEAAHEVTSLLRVSYNEICNDICVREQNGRNRISVEVGNSPVIEASIGNPGSKVLIGNASNHNNNILISCKNQKTNNMSIIQHSNQDTLVSEIGTNYYQSKQCNKSVSTPQFSFFSKGAMEAFFDLNNGKFLHGILSKFRSRSELKAGKLVDVYDTDTHSWRVGRVRSWAAEHIVISLYGFTQKDDIVLSINKDIAGRLFPYRWRTKNIYYPKINTEFVRLPSSSKKRTHSDLEGSEVSILISNPTFSNIKFVIQRHSKLNDIIHEYYRVSGIDYKSKINYSELKKHPLYIPVKEVQKTIGDDGNNNINAHIDGDVNTRLNQNTSATQHDNTKSFKIIEVFYDSNASVDDLLSSDQGYIPIGNSDFSLQILTSVAINVSELRNHGSDIQRRKKKSFIRFRVTVQKIIALQRFFAILKKVRNVSASSSSSTQVSTTSFLSALNGEMHSVESWRYYDFLHEMRRGRHRGDVEDTELMHDARMLELLERRLLRRRVVRLQR
jgi:ubiquitin-protein ligase